MELSECGDVADVEGVWEGEPWSDSIVYMFFFLQRVRRHLNTCRLANLSVNK